MEYNNTRIQNTEILITPREIRTIIPISEKAMQTIVDARNSVIKTLNGDDNRLLVITGPCSIHSEKIALEYAEKLNTLRNKYNDKLNIVMRVYFEKPRTIVGWKGLISDPHLNNSYDIETGLKKARKILLDIADMGMPTATEILDPIIAGYLGQLVAWVAIGARTTESQTHRQMTSGLSAPVGFKNGTNGSIDVAVNAIKAAAVPQSFLGVDDIGHCSIIHTKGNAHGHLVLRGGKNKPNYSSQDVKECEEKLAALNLPPQIIIDCSHDNSNKDYRNQVNVVANIIEQKKAGNQSIKGIMLESNLFEGNQSIPDDLNNLKYGVSITDGCIGWETTAELLEFVHKSL